MEPPPSHAADRNNCNRPSNRVWREDLVASSGQDAYYQYDTLYQLTNLQRGDHNSGKTGIEQPPPWEEQIRYHIDGVGQDVCGNSAGYDTFEDGDQILYQDREHNKGNEIVKIDGSTAYIAHDDAGNMTKAPKPADWLAAFDLVYDAWNRLVEVKDGETTVATYRYDGLMRRVKKETDDEVRHYFYSDQWQVIEERVEVENEEIELVLDRQWVWGLRRLDDVVLRDRDTDADGDLDERLYALDDGLNPSAVINPSGTVLERYGYDAFGASRVMAADWSARSSSNYDWEARFGGYRWDGETGLYQVRHRCFHPGLGRWISRDPLSEENAMGAFGPSKLSNMETDNPYIYLTNNPLLVVDPMGLGSYCACLFQCAQDCIKSNAGPDETPTQACLAACAACIAIPQGKVLCGVCAICGGLGTGIVYGCYAHCVGSCAGDPDYKYKPGGILK